MMEDQAAARQRAGEAARAPPGHWTATRRARRGTGRRPPTPATPPRRGNRQRHERARSPPLNGTVAALREQLARAEAALDRERDRQHETTVLLRGLITGPDPAAGKTAGPPPARRAVITAGCRGGPDGPPRHSQPATREGTPDDHDQPRQPRPEAHCCAPSSSASSRPPSPNGSPRPASRKCPTPTSSSSCCPTRSPAARTARPPAAPAPPGSTPPCAWTPGTPPPPSATTSSSGTSSPRLRFAEAGHGALILGPVGVGKTHLATALGHIAVRRRLTVPMARADQLFKKLKAARLDNSTEAEHRRLAAVSVLIIDDFALQPLDETATTDFYELTVARHRKNATIVTSNRTPDEWVTLMSDPLLAQSAVDRLASTCHELIVEGESYRRRQRPAITRSLTNPDQPPQDDPAAARWSLGRGNTLVPCSWQMTPGVPEHVMTSGNRFV